MSQTAPIQLKTTIKTIDLQKLAFVDITPTFKKLRIPKIILLILVFFINCCNCKATTYYVDNAGNNINNGTSPGKAWQTLAKVNNYKFSPGDSILFKCEGIWRETLIISSSGANGNNIIYSNYGSGSKPIISGADLFSSWTNEGGNYYTSVAAQPKFVFENGIPLVASTSKEALSPGVFWRDNRNSRLYISFNPIGHTLEASQRNAAINTNENSYITIDGLQLVKTNFHGINGLHSTHSIYRNCIINYIPSRGIYTNSYSLPATYITIEGNSFNHNQGYAIYMFGGKDTIRNNTIKNIGDYYTTATPYAIYPSGIDIDQNGVTGVINTQIYNNIIDTLYGHGSGLYTHGIYIQYGTSGLNIYGNTISNNMSGDAIKFAGAGDIHDNILYNNKYAGIGIHNNNSPVIVNVYRNLIYNNGYGLQQYNLGTNKGLYNPSATLTLNIYNNTFYKNAVNSPSGSNCELYLHDNINSVTIKNNIFYARNTYLCYYFVPQSNLASDYNILYREDEGKLIVLDGAAKTWEQWQNLANDLHSFNLNPLISHSDFHLLPLSPAILSGVDVHSKGPIDIGAFPYKRPKSNAGPDTF